jgi:hypothetical protein
VDNRSPYLLDRRAATLNELAAAATHAREQYGRTHAMPDWEIACEAQGRYQATLRETRVRQAAESP